MTYSKELRELVQEQLNANINGVSTHKVRMLLERHLDETKRLVDNLVGRDLVIDDLTIPGTINNQRYYARSMYSMFMEELDTN